MDETLNVKISMKLFGDIVVILEWLEFSNCAIPHAFKLDTVLSDLREKQLKINLHSAYTKKICAKDDAQRRIACSDYLKLKKLSGRQ